MTSAQIYAFAVIALMMAAFIWGRLRYDLVAALALLLAVATGIVPYEDAFSGFSDEIVIIVGSALLVSAAVARSGIMEVAIQRFAPGISSVRGQLTLLVIIVTILSAFVKNIGALAIMMPIAFQFARRSGVSPSVFLMPMAFGSLLGGLMTQIGTSPNIIVSRVREDIGGTPFTMFDFTPVGAALAVVGIVFLVLFYWLVPQRSRATASMHEAIDIKNYVTEARVVATSTVIDQTVRDLAKIAEGEAMVMQIVRAGNRRLTPLPDVTLKEDDIVILEGSPEALDRLVAQGGLQLSSDRRAAVAVESAAEIGAIEAVVGESSELIGRTARQFALFDRHQVNLLAISRKGQRLSSRLGEVQIRMGDVLVLQGSLERLPELLRDLGCLPLAERPLRLGSVRRGLVPIAILGAAMISTALGVLPVAVAFFGAAVLMVLARAVPLREVYDSIDGPILVMLAALIPVSDALRTTGGTDLIAKLLSDISHSLPPYGALALILVAAMAVTPFLNNAATVLVMAPIAAGFASGLGYRPEAFLMAVAIGAGCDFLTPIGHQCNTLVMGPGGYRFGDYSRLGLPLSILVVFVAVPMLMLVWPLR
ncbi:SLC13 family permease [Mangrovicella endophytica]|uniref:SLC13 family permease n=1 Tax=Mangrovicella endophytica TaxID=2066697 RepID=UPI000C9E69F5|nr:SLC13 family permease [Mangrovicella endophytica]